MRIESRLPGRGITRPAQVSLRTRKAGDAPAIAKRGPSGPRRSSSCAGKGRPPLPKTRRQMAAWAALSVCWHRRHTARLVAAKCRPSALDHAADRAHDPSGRIDARISATRSCDDNGHSRDGSPARCEADCRPARGPVGQRAASNERGGRACGLVQKDCTIRSRLRRDIVHQTEFPALLIEQLCNSCVARGRSPALRAFRYGSTRR